MEKTVKPIHITFLSFFLRLVPVVFIVTIIFYLITPFFINGHLKFFKNELKILHPEYKILSSDIVEENQINYIQFSIKVNKHSSNPYTSVKKGSILTVRGQASSLCIAPIIIFSLILAWPGLTIKKRLKTILIAIPMIFVLAALDYPMLFITNIETAYSDISLLNYIRKIWKHIMINGGRQFLALAVFLFAITLANLNPKQITMDKVSRNDPCPCGSGKKYKHCCLS